MWDELEDGDSFSIWKYRRKQSPENPNWSALEHAIASDDLTAVRSLIEGGKVGLDEQNLYQEERYTPLLLAIESEAFACWRVCSIGNTNSGLKS
jgi:hypothetical protein